MSEIGIAAWHAGDRSVSTDDLQERFNKPPLRSWFDQAGTGNSGLGAILTAFYTRPEDSANPDSGLAQRYVFSHKSFREYLTGVGIVRFLEKLADQLSAEAEDGWSDQDALREWVLLFGPTAFDQRQWQFLLTELQSSFASKPQKFQRVKQAVEQVFGLALRRRTTLLEVGSIGQVAKSIGNAEEAMICVLDSLRRADILQTNDNVIQINWPNDALATDSSQQDATLLSEMFHRIRARPGSPDEMTLSHAACLFEKGGPGLLKQINTVIKTRVDGWLYAQSFDFTGMDLADASFEGANLIYGKFHRATVSGANFSYGNFFGADFGDVGSHGNRGSMKLTKFDHADLTQSRWNNASVNISFNAAILFGADMRGAEVDLDDAADVDGTVTGVMPYRERSDSPSAGRSSPRTNKSRIRRRPSVSGTA
ncbi:MAG: pentapeptide repeat-containing protein [Oxalobacteraceae bacterium]|nr:MAG: pentapeptide repeat-containing protein [Oxalobacteraceae bacterium]